MKLASCVMSGAGKVRRINQDNYYLNGIYRDSNPTASTEVYTDEVYSGNALYALADGLGGESYGEAASFLAVSHLNEITAPVTIDKFQRYLENCNQEVLHFIRTHGEIRGGSTFVGLSIHDQIAEVVNIGDSRAYLFRDGVLRQLSTDHTQISQLMKTGLITPECARTHPGRHQLSQYLGVSPEEMIIEPDAAQEEVQSGDLFLLCSDGLYEMVEEFRIERILSASARVKEKTIALYELAMRFGGKDNTTVILVGVEKER